MEPNHRNRRWPHLRRFDYRSPGAYFVTICTFRRQNLWGQVADGKVELSRAGEVADHSWREIPRHFPHVRLDSYIVMPDHVHGLLLVRSRLLQNVGTTHVQNVGTTHASSLQGRSARPRGPSSGSLASIIGSYKSAVTRRLHRAGNGSPDRIWQSGFYERVVRNSEELATLREYITTNPLRWALKLRTKLEGLNE